MDRKHKNPVTKLKLCLVNLRLSSNIVSECIENNAYTNQNRK